MLRKVLNNTSRKFFCTFIVQQSWTKKGRTRFAHVYEVQKSILVCEKQKIYLVNRWNKNALKAIGAFLIRQFWKSACLLPFDKKTSVCSDWLKKKMKMEPGTHALHTYWNSEDHLPSHWGTDSGAFTVYYTAGVSKLFCPRAT